MQMESTRSRLDDGLITFKKTLTLPVELRGELKRPLGEVVNEEQLEILLRTAKTLVSVGDLSSLTLYNMGIIPDIAIVDFKTQRDDISHMKAQIQKIGQIVINVECPPGIITRQLWDAIENAYQMEEKVRIEVFGEEDLAALPCICLAPENTAVVYGLPDTGIVVVFAGKEAKMKVKDVLTKMK